jgi:hypothetical protein
MVKRSGTIGFLLAALLLGCADVLAAQMVASPLPSWRPGVRIEPRVRLWTGSADLSPHSEAISRSHSHTLTGLLVGSLVGAAATGLFLTAFCSDPDTHCGADEVGRAVLIIAVPSAVVGALIGSLIRTES